MKGLSITAARKTHELSLVERLAHSRLDAPHGKHTREGMARAKRHYHYYSRNTGNTNYTSNTTRKSTNKSITG